MMTLKTLLHPKKLFHRKSNGFSLVCIMVMLILSPGVITAEYTNSRINFMAQAEKIFGANQNAAVASSSKTEGTAEPLSAFMGNSPISTDFSNLTAVQTQETPLIQNGDFASKTGTNTYPDGWQNRVEGGKVAGYLNSFDGRTGVIDLSSTSNVGVGLKQSVTPPQNVKNIHVDLTFKISNASLSGDGYYGIESPVHLILTFETPDRVSVASRKLFNYTSDSGSGTNSDFILVPKNTWVTKSFNFSDFHVSETYKLKSIEILSNGWSRQAYVDSVKLYETTEAPAPPPVNPPPTTSLEIKAVNTTTIEALSGHYYPGSNGQPVYYTSYYYRSGLFIQRQGPSYDLHTYRAFMEVNLSSFYQSGIDLSKVKKIELTFSAVSTASGSFNFSVYDMQKQEDGIFASSSIGSAKHYTVTSSLIKNFQNYSLAKNQTKTITLEVTQAILRDLQAGQLWSGFYITPNGAMSKVALSGPSVKIYY